MRGSVRAVAVVSDGRRFTQDMEAVFGPRLSRGVVENTVFRVAPQDFMNGVCTHIVQLNEHTKKLDYYTGVL